MKHLLATSLIATSLLAQNFDRVRPQEPTDFQKSQGTYHVSEKDFPKVPHGEEVLLQYWRGHGNNRHKRSRYRATLEESYIVL